jgi:hypothetical protein
MAFIHLRVSARASFVKFCKRGTTPCHCCVCAQRCIALSLFKETNGTQTISLLGGLCMQIPPRFQVLRETIQVLFLNHEEVQDLIETILVNCFMSSLIEAKVRLASLRPQLVL